MCANISVCGVNRARGSMKVHNNKTVSGAKTEKDKAREREKFVLKEKDRTIVEIREVVLRPKKNPGTFSE